MKPGKRGGIEILLWGLFFTLVACSNLFKPDIPIQLSHRESALGQGYVMQFHNKCDKYLRVAVDFQDAATGRSTGIKMLDLPPSLTTEIGWAEGHKFASGDVITVTHNDYRDLRYQIP